MFSTLQWGQSKFRNLKERSMEPLKLEQHIQTILDYISKREVISAHPFPLSTHPYLFPLKNAYKVVCTNHSPSKFFNKGISFFTELTITFPASFSTRKRNMYKFSNGQRKKLAIHPNPTQKS